jgi:hypothetical protein
MTRKVSVVIFGEWIMFRFLWLKVHGFTGAEPCFDVTRPAKFPACDSNGNAKQGKQGEAKEKVGGFQITPLSIMQSACNPSNLASCFAVIAPP